MKISVLFVSFFFLAPVPPVKCAMRDTYNCFLKKGNCRFECHEFEKPVGFCTKLKANCCMLKSEI
ncbi:beta-defensin 133 [Trichechus manatus latirostris]|uniref:Beta-defensin n=1 Tax=Trichechus manatus latirostris TaxID=127582 RepID=A0A2Y9S2W5_TRIMA|nr:beta-defensin 133 [Trichechus manatus latirostris]